MGLLSAYLFIRCIEFKFALLFLLGINALMFAFLASITGARGGLPSGPFAPHVKPTAPKPNWNWNRIPTSFHGAVKVCVSTNYVTLHN